MFLSSHQIPEVERVADYVAIVNEGKILVCHRLDELKQALERWVITTEDQSVQLPKFDGTVLTHEGQGERRQQIIVCNPGPNAIVDLARFERCC